MQIKNMFAKQIDRDIKGVIKVGQGDDANVQQELSEYVVTRELQKHFADFFANYKTGIVGNTDKMGVWISGFFGSGKSHFLKILSYLLDNREVDGKRAIDYFVEDKKITDPYVLADMKLAADTPADVILFNIDSKSEIQGKQSKDAIVSVLLRVFNGRQGFCESNSVIADLERTLSEKGQYDNFKAEFESINGSPWVEARNEFDFIQDDVVDALVAIDFMSEEAARNWCEKAMDGIDRKSIEDFAKLIKRYIDQKGENHHVVFLIDEIGQYIGDSRDLMLNLQTVTEDLGTACQGKAWIIVTSQQDIDSVAKEISHNKNDFSKIQGRFDTRLSLSSANVDEVIRKRILEKNDAGHDTLALLYDQKETDIKNKIIFNDGVEKKLYTNRENFAAVYPFVPYQFNLLGSVLTSIRTHGASGKHLAEGERSMLALFKDSAERLMNENEGALVPFNMFYDALEKFLDHSYRGVIYKAWDNDYLNPDREKECFNVNVLKVLFMIKYVKEITANVEQITSLMIDSVDTDRMSLQQRVEDALKLLVKQTLVQKNGDVYVFLTDEEQEVQRDIEAENVEIAEVIGAVSEMIFDDLYDAKKYRYPAMNGRYTFGFNQFVDDRPYRANQNYDVSLKIITPDWDMRSDEATMRMLSGQERSVLVVLPDDREFMTELRQAMQIHKYLTRGAANTLTKFEQIRQMKSVEEKERRNNARIFLEAALREAVIFVNGDKLQLSGKDISSRINEGIGKLIAAVYYKLGYIDTATNEGNIRSLLKSSAQYQLKLDGGVVINKLALSDLEEYLNLNTTRSHARTSLKTLYDRYMKAPYGFIEDDVRYLVAKLFKDGKISMFVSSEPITLMNKSDEEIIRYLTKREYPEKLLMEYREVTPEKHKKAVREVMRELFGITSVDDNEDTVMADFIRRSRDLKNDLEKLEIRQQSNPQYPGRSVVRTGKALMNEVIGLTYPAEFFKTIYDKQDDYLDFAQDYEPMKAFYEGEQLQIFEKAIRHMKIYEDSKTFIVNEEIEHIASQIKSIMAKTAPYGEIYKLPGLLDSFANRYVDMCKEIEEPIQAAIVAARKRVFDELEGKQCHDKLSNRYAEAWRELREKANTCNNVATLQNIKVEADALKIRHLNEIAETEAKLQAAAQAAAEAAAQAAAAKSTTSSDVKRGDTAPIQPAQEPIQPISSVKPVKIEKKKSISIKSVTSQYSWQIKSEEDIDKYLRELRTKLLGVLEEDTTVNIEF